MKTQKIFIPDLATSVAGNLEQADIDLLKATDMKTIKFALKNDTKRAALNTDWFDSADTDERHAYAAYDAGRILARAIDELGKNGTVAELKTKIPEVARAYSPQALIHSTVLSTTTGDLECTTYDVLEINDTASAAGTIVFNNNPTQRNTCDATDPDADGLSVPMLNSPQLVSCIDCAINSFGEIFGQTVQVHQQANHTTITNILDIHDDSELAILIEYQNPVITDSEDDPIVLDFFAFGFGDDGRTANQIVRLELEETDDNTSTFTGGLEYIMLNQLNILDDSTYTGLDTISDEPTFIVMEDLTDEDSPRVNYLDLGEDGVSTQIADQQEAPSHSGVVALDSESYKVADTVIITLTDADLNVDSDLVDIFTTVEPGNYTMSDTVGDNVMFNGKSVEIDDAPLGRVLDVTFDDQTWTENMCGDKANFDDGLHDTGFTLIETEKASGVFTGSFQIPTEYCRDDAKFVCESGFTPVTRNGDKMCKNDNAEEYVDGKYMRDSVTGTDIEVKLS